MEPKDWIELVVVIVGIATFCWSRRAQRVDHAEQRRDALLDKAVPAVVAIRSLVATRNPTSVEVAVMSGRFDEADVEQLIASDNKRWRWASKVVGEVADAHRSPAVKVAGHDLKLALSRYLSHVHLVLMTGTIGEEAVAEDLSRAVFAAADELVDALHDRVAV